MANNWTTTQHGDSYLITAPDGDDDIVVAAINGGQNARLIAAAPEMMAALKAMLAHSCVEASAEDKDQADHAAERLARAAIAKAEGGE